MQDHAFTIMRHDLEWYHPNEPSTIDLTNYDGNLDAIKDDRLDKIIDEHTRYMRETGREIWNV